MKRMICIAALTLALVTALALNLSPYLRGPDSWRWAYALPGRPGRHLLPAAALVSYSAVVICTWRRFARRKTSASRREQLAFALFAAAAAPLLQLALLYPDAPDVLRPLLYRTLSPEGSGVFTVSSHVNDLGAFLRQYPVLMPTFPVHPQRYPPGLVVLFHLTRQALALAPGLANRMGMALRTYQCHDLALMQLPNAAIASAALQMALPVLASLAILPLYTLAKETAGERAALFAVGFYPLVPSFALWSARWDQAYPLFACAVWALFAIGLKRRRWSWMLAAGLVLGAATFLSFGLVVLLMPLGLWALLRPATEDEGWHALWTAVRGPYPRLGMAFFAGLVLPWLLYQTAFGSGFIEIWRISMSFHLGLARNYWVWLAYHPYDFLLFLGIPLAALFVLSLVELARERARGPRLPGTAFVLTIGLSLLLLNLSGAAQGEVARVWIFLTPFPVIAAAATLAWESPTNKEPGQRTGQARTPEEAIRAVRPAAATLILLALQLLVFNYYLRVVTTGVNDPPTRTRTFTDPGLPHALHAELGGDLVFLGFALATDSAWPAASVEPGSTLTLTLGQQAVGQMAHSYTLFTHLISSDGDLVAQHDSLPQQGRAPTSCWHPGEIILSTYTLHIPPDAAAGTYTLYTGLYRYETGERLPLRGASVTPDRSVYLTTIEVAED
jgi:hypothetical protein